MDTAPNPFVFDIHTRRLRIAIAVLLLVPLVLCVVAFTLRTWREYAVESDATPDMTFQGLRVGIHELCVRNDVSLANASLAAFDGDVCYPLRKPTRVPQLNASEPTHVTWATLTLCGDRGPVFPGSLLQVSVLSPEFIESLGVPHAASNDANFLLNSICHSYMLEIHAVILGVLSASLVSYGIAQCIQGPAMLRLVELATAFIAMLGAVMLAVERLLWTGESPALGHGGSAMALCLVSILVLFVPAGLLFAHNVKFNLTKKKTNAATTHSPQATDCLDTHSVRYRIGIAHLLIAPLALSALALAWPTWCDLHTEIAQTSPITFRGLRIGLYDMCIRSRVSETVNVSVVELDGEFYYPLRKSASIRLLNDTATVQVYHQTLTICAVKDSLRMSKQLHAMGIPDAIFYDTVDLVNTLCGPTPLALHAWVMTVLVCAMVSIFTTQFARDSVLRKRFELETALLAVVSAVFLSIVVAYAIKTSTPIGTTGLYIDLCIAAEGVAVVAATVLVWSYWKSPTHVPEDVLVSPRALDRLV